ncbi:hypothetical protein [Vibrio vulnificus]|uniref:hypothetical protein n=1 Tax=Vibrio vulnificus TaxID=672 RepID=UPI0018DE3021|nr:hypothetical protein [Vibrio vulnificus]MDT8803372.1 hypothetical protein [Vibrio vulnificus]HAS6043924.1 hypothetical protein [Vibrio vulnificus]
MRQDKPTAPLSHKRSAHRRHTTNCIPVHTGNHLSAIAVCRVGNTLTAKNNYIEQNQQQRWQ